ncbi:MAG: hypothetical protein ACP5O7_12455, partial [Phycisphaerae bacterium]
VVTWKNHLAVGTDEGIALGEINEQSAAGHVPLVNLTFEHGQNFVAKVHGLWHPPKHWQAPPGQVLEKLPTEDHTTAVAWEADKAAGGKAGYLWLGHWRTGLDVWQYSTEGKIINRWHIHEPQVGNYVESLQPLQGGAMAVGCYGRGVEIITLPGQSRDAWRNAAKTETQLAVAPEPQGARPPTLHELAGAIPALSSGTSEASGIHFPWAAPLRTDWATQGDEVGRYGRQCGILCAAGGVVDGDLSAAAGIKVRPMQGPHALRGDGLRRWVQRARSRNLSCLYAPWQGSRIGSSWDDHGEAYPVTLSGPGIAVAIALPPPRGLYCLSLYFHDGHPSTDRQRDYWIEIFPLPQRLWHDVAPPSNGFPSFPRNLVAKGWVYRASRSRPLAQARVVHFWGPAYERFVLSGPGDYLVLIHRNHSFNTILSGLFLDRLSDRQPNAGRPCAWLAGVAYQPPRRPPSADTRVPLAAAERLWQIARGALSRPWAAQPAEVAAYRCACASASPGALLARWRWRMDLWEAADRRRFNFAMAAAFAALNARQASQAALLRAMAKAKKKGSRHFVWRGSWANPVNPK